MAKQLTAPGCIYSIVARVDTTIYSPDQTWILDVPAGQTDFIAETNEIIIPGDAMMRRKTRQHIKDRDRINLLGVGSGSLEGFIARAIEQIVGKGNVTVTYGEGKLTVVLADSVTTAQIATVESLLERMLPKDVEGETVQVGKLPTDYTRVEFLESTGARQWIDTGYVPNNETGIYLYQLKIAIGDSIPMGCRNSLTTETRFYALRSMASPLEGGITMGFGWGKWFVVSSSYGLAKTYTNYMNDRVVTGENTAPLDVAALQFTPEYSIFMFAANVAGQAYHLWDGRIYEAAISQGKSIAMSFVPALDPAGVPCMYDTIAGQPFRNDGAGQFIVGMTLEQVRGLSLPTGGGQLTLSLPHEASIDRLAQVALEQARANGWQLTLQYAESDVPAGYRKLDFLESTSTQWIDSGVPYASDTCIETTFEITQWNDGYSPGLFGTENSNNANEARFGVLTYSHSFRWDYGSQIKREYVSRSLNTKYKLKKDGPDNYIDDVLVSSNTPGDFISDSTGLIFSRKSPSGFIGKIYSFAISRAGEMQADYVPCISPDGKLGMYNKVDGTLQENAGTGSFIAGLATVDDVLNLWLPETNGTLTISVPADTPDSAVDQLRENNPTWQIAIQFRTDNEN